MRNPIRLKNMRWRFVPPFAVGLVLLFTTRPSVFEYCLGLVAILAGGALRAWGAGHLVKTERLTITGPYAHVRHPLYLGTLLVGVGLAINVGGWAAVLVLAVFLPWFFLAYFPRKDRTESQRLAAAYGAAFADYGAQVPALLPRITRWRATEPALALGDPDLRWSRERYSQNNELGTLLALVACVVAFALRTWRII